MNLTSTSIFNNAQTLMRDNSWTTAVLVFLFAVIYETAAKSLGLPLLSRGLNRVSDLLAKFWDALGYWCGRVVNLWFIFKLIRDNIWKRVKPVLDSVCALASPIVRICVSWVWFFAGFARNHYVVTSYAGVAVCAYSTIVFFPEHVVAVIVLVREMLTLKMCVTFLLVSLAGARLTYGPTIWVSLFPSTARSICFSTRGLEGSRFRKRLHNEVILNVQVNIDRRFLDCYTREEIVEMYRLVDWSGYNESGADSLTKEAIINKFLTTHTSTKHE